MNIDQFISKLETSDAYRNNGEVRKLVDQSRQVLIDLAHGNDGDAFKAELMKFNDRLDECLSPTPHGSAEIAEGMKPIIVTLKSRFESHLDWHEGIEWAEVEQSLKANPETLSSLQKMEETGGEPDLLMVEENGDFVFCDCSDESPKGRRNLDYSLFLADEVDIQDVELIDEANYRLLQARKPVDRNSWSWIKTPQNALPSGYALRGIGGDKGFMDISKVNANYFDEDGGWRGVLKVKKVTPEVSPEAKLLQILKTRFEAHPERHKGVDWAEVEKSLKANPEKLASLKKMEEAGGDPDVFMAGDGFFVFCDCSAPLPADRFKLVYAESAEMARKLGAELIDMAQYRHLQTLGAFDTDRMCWLKTPEDILETGYALYGYWLPDGATILRTEATYCNLGWRGVLKVPKV